jgi:tetratricopeptide (TPR) repeat protein
MKKIKIGFVVLLACQHISTSAQGLKADISNLSMPVIDWSLCMDLKDFNVQENNFSPDGTSRQIFADKNKDLEVSVFIEKADHEGNAVECRKFYWSKAEKSPFSKDNLKQYEKSDIAFVEHDTKEYEGKKVDYHSMNAYLSHEGYWIDIHISKTGYTTNDKILFDQIINSIKIEKPKRINLSELFIFGAQTYYARNYKATIVAYEPMLEPDKELITIDKIIWTIVVDNLGMSYGVTGDLKNAKRIFEYAINKDPDYPNFYYNLACTYAEMSDLDNALLNLELAYDKKDKVLPGEKLSNPKNDSSFKNYISDKRFVKFLKKHDL